MENTKKTIVDILINNFCISEVFDYPHLSIEFGEPNETDENIFRISMFVKTDDDYQSDIEFVVNMTEYDEKFEDVDMYEVDDMGAIILIYNQDADNFEVDSITLWKMLFFYKRKIQWK